MSLFDTFHVSIISSNCSVPDAAASFSSVEMSAPASGARAEARSRPRGHWTGPRAGCLVGDDVDPHPHVRQALHRHEAQSDFQIYKFYQVFLRRILN